MPIKQVIVFRKDLNVRKGKLAAQVAHASLKVFLDRKVPSSTNDLVIPLWPEGKEWIDGIFTKVVLGCENEAALLELGEKAKELPHALIEDAGLTEFHGIPTLTCLAIGPAEASEIDKVTGHLKPL